MSTFIEKLIGLGIHSEPATEIAGVVDADVTAAGTNLATAAQLRARFNLVTTAASGTGVKLPQTVAIGESVVVQNLGANDIEVFPPTTTGIFNSASAGGGLTLAAATDQILVAIKVSATQWIGLVGAGPAT